MKFQDILIPISLALLTTWLVSYFFNKNEPQGKEVAVQAGQSFKVPEKEQLLKPLITEIDFIDTDIPCENALQKTGSMHYEVQFSSCGAMITQMDFKRLVGKQEDVLTTLTVNPAVNKDNGAFLLALQDKTPFAYTLVSHKTEGETPAVINTYVYRSVNTDVLVEKEFTLDSRTHKIDLIVRIDPQGKSVQPRLFIPTPYLAGDLSADVAQGIAMNEHATLEKMKANAVEGRVWASPVIFGSENRYFVNALVADTDNFVQRAYYKLTGVQGCTAILEGPTITEKTEWKMSFYCGPKLVESMEQVDPRLEATLDYGWFGFVAKLLMTLLRLIYSVVRNYGLAIILLTILIKLLLLPFTIRAERSARKASELRKKLQHLEQKYKHDAQELAYQKSELMKKNGISDMLGCLPVLAQIPLFLGLSKALSTSLELYHAPFVGWITDLSVRDPYYVLPALVGIGLFVQSGLSASTDPRGRLTSIVLALFVGGVTANIAAGLALFIVVSTWMSVAQSYVQKMRA